MALRTPAALWGARLSMMTMSRGLSVGTSTCSTWVEGRPVHRPVEDHRRHHAGEPQAGDEGGGLPVTMRDYSPAAFAPRRPSAQAGHLGRRPCLVDEDRALRIEVELPLEPGLAPLHDVGPILLGGMRRLFLNVMPRRSKKRQTVPRATPSPRSCRSFSASSASVMSGFADTWLRMNAASASIRPDRRSPPSFRGAHEPSRRSNCHQRIALAALTPNRCAA